MGLLEPPDAHYFSAALGWLGLGNVAEAEAELAQVSAANARHPDVLEARWLICAERKQWDEGLEIARLLLQAAPERVSGWVHQAYCLRRIPEGSLHCAWKALLPAFERFRDEAVIPYNLACYACQMGELEKARAWLKQAVAIAGKDQIRPQALKDPDLAPLWPEIRAL